MNTKKRLNTTLPEKTIEKLEEYSKNYGMSKSTAIAMIVEQYFEQKDLIERTKQMPTMIEQLQAMVEITKKDRESK